MTIRYVFAAGLVLAAQAGCAQDDAQAQPSGEASAALSASDQDAAFKAAGFAKKGQNWVKCVEDPPTLSYTPGSIEQSGDFNGDGRPDAVIVESSLFCYGQEGTSFAVVSKQADGAWKLITENSGVATFLTTKGAGGWPDLSVGGPGFCFPVERWNGTEYALDRWEYEGKACQRPG